MLAINVCHVDNVFDNVFKVNYLSVDTDNMSNTMDIIANAKVLLPDTNRAFEFTKHRICGFSMQTFQVLPKGGRIGISSSAVQHRAEETFLKAS